MKQLFLAMDFMIGVADQPYAEAAVRQANAAIAAARTRGSTIVFTKVGFRQGHPEVSSRNKVFRSLLGSDKLVGAGSSLAPPFSPRDGEPVLDKKRFSAFSGSGLWTIVRSSGATAVTLCGLSTSGVVLSTSLELIDADFDVTILFDACADPEPGVHDTIVEKILGPRATVCSVADWQSATSQVGGAA